MKKNKTTSMNNHSHLVIKTNTVSNLHKWKRLAEKTVVETFCGREDGRYSLLTEECEKCGKIRQINLRGK